MIKKNMTSVKLPKNIAQKILVRVVEYGYGLKGKSRWIEEAIKDFLLMPNINELVSIAGDMEPLDTTVSIWLSKETIKQLEDGVVRVRKEDPGFEGVKSNIIRASIMQRLIVQQPFSY